jgi:hypothetical protein
LERDPPPLERHEHRLGGRSLGVLHLGDRGEAQRHQEIEERRAGEMESGPWFPHGGAAVDDAQVLAPERAAAGDAGGHDRDVGRHPRESRSDLEERVRVEIAEQSSAKATSK